MKIDERQDGVEIVTEGGRLHARKIAYATGYNSEQYLTTPKANLSTYSLASQPNASTEGWPEGMLLWETARPYFYQRRIGLHWNAAGTATYFALGYGGNGITFSAIAAKLIRYLCVGRSIPDAEVFRFGR